MEEKTIYDLALHESITLPFGPFVMKVPGGWIYDCWDFERDTFKQGMFVPDPRGIVYDIPV